MVNFSTRSTSNGIKQKLQIELMIMLESNGEKTFFSHFYKLRVLFAHRQSTHHKYHQVMKGYAI